ncbi:glycosyltransferase family 1 protein [Ramlibacter monticola]|uniref:Glycosyltransferase family 1 protein n=1 Tax=Ramlibacter monticola TaxID=1926872 RepID=A0A936Z395_9BURK|nr:glycosyltransferase [Ramlibacter monticola]MBL0393988.1 glycosyltransferase family 1 protein [Ramlibacter monticola]
MRIGLQTWGSEGDVTPFLALAAGLVRRGHEVRLVVTDNARRDYRRHALADGYELVEVPLPGADAQSQERLWREVLALSNPLRQVEVILRHGYDPAAPAMLRAAHDMVARSDAVVGHFFAYPLRIAAEHAGVPAATLAIVHNCIPTRERAAPGLPDPGRWSHGPGWRLAAWILNRIFLPRYNGQRHAVGLPPVRDTMTGAWASPLLNLVAVSPQICRRPADWGPNHVVAGFLNPADAPVRPLPDPLERFLAGGDPPVFFGFGSMMPAHADARETIALWARAVARLGCRAVFQLPAALLPLVPQDPRTCAVEWADYRLLFPRCAAIVHHGGSGTTQSALRAGRASVVVSHIADQAFWGQELERLRVAGPSQRRQGLRARRLQAAIRAVLDDPALARNAARLGAAMAEEDGVRVAVEAIEGRLGKGVLP